MKTKKKSPRKLSRKVAVNRLIMAAAKWVDAAGGKAIVAGGAGIMDCADFGGESLNFYVVVKITGRRPQQEKKS